jgi:dihydroflavonol-4-reductase
MEGVGTLYHLAAIAHFWRADRHDFERVNRIGTERVLAAAAAAAVARVVHCSTESILLAGRRAGAAIDESVRATLADQPGPYTRSKFQAEQAALAAARDGLDLVVVNPTVPIGSGDRNFTPPAAMLDAFLSGRARLFVDCVLNLVDVRDVAEGMVLAAERGRTGERYILGGENVTLRSLLASLERLSGRPMPRRALPPSLAKAAALLLEGTAAITGRPPAATREGVALALRSAPIDSAKAKRELGYRARPVEEALTQVVELFKQRQGGARR